MSYQVQANVFGEVRLSVPQAAYIAGLFDGEGSIYLVARKGAGRRSHHFHCEMTLGNSYLPILEWLVKATGNGAIYETRKAVGANHKPVYRWQLQPSQMRHVLPQIRPYLIVKRAQADLMLEFFDLQRQADRGPRGTPPPEVIEKILALYAELRRLNRRGLSEAEALVFSMGDAAPRQARICAVADCGARCYRGEDQCYKHWLRVSERIPKVCEECGASMDAVLARKRFCSRGCKNQNGYKRRKAAAAPKEEAEN